jgi:hypothetical protein
VIWGLRSGGFNNNLLSHPAHGIDGVLGALHDERQLCFTQARPFLSIERTDGHNLLTIFKVDALDNAKNRAFIGITVFVPRHNRLKAMSGTLPEAMHELLRFYEQEQGSAVIQNAITADELIQKVQSLFQVVVCGSGAGPSKGRTYAVCPTVEEESKLLEGSAWFNVRQVLLFREKPDLEAAGLTGYERFDPNKRKGGEQPVPAQGVSGGIALGPKTRRRKHSAWIIASVVALSLLVVGGGAWWVFDDKRTTDFPAQVPMLSDTTGAHGTNPSDSDSVPVQSSDTIGPRIKPTPPPSDNSDATQKTEAKTEPVENPITEVKKEKTVVQCREWCECVKLNGEEKCNDGMIKPSSCPCQKQTENGE